MKGQQNIRKTYILLTLLAFLTFFEFALFPIFHSHDDNPLNSGSSQWHSTCAFCQTMPVTTIVVEKHDIVFLEIDQELLQSSVSQPNDPPFSYLPFSRGPPLL